MVDFISFEHPKIKTTHETYFHPDGIPLDFIFFIGCNDPFQDSSAKNHFKVDGNTIMIHSAAMVNLTGNKVLNEMKGLLFASNGIAFTSKSGKVLQINGK